MAEPEYDTEEIYELWSEQPVEVIRRCRHVNLEPVTSVVDHVVVAQLCVDCDQQLGPDAHTISQERHDLISGLDQSIQQLAGLTARVALVGPDRTPTAFHVPREPSPWHYLMTFLVILSVLVIFVLVTW